MDGHGIGRTEAAQEAKEKFEAALVDWMVAEREDNVIMTGYVLKAVGVVLEEGNLSQSIWSVPTNQSIYLTLGLVSALQEDVSNAYNGPEED